jgi:hypothetical protein
MRAVREPAPNVTTRTGRAPHGPNEELGCDIPGVLRVVVRDAEPEDARAVARDVGIPRRLRPAVQARTPRRLDVSFVDRMSTSELRLLDGGGVGFSGAGLYVLAGKGSPRAFVRQGTACGTGSIVCTRGSYRIPFLSAAVDIAALAGEWAPLHASAWVTPEGVGVIASGWAHSGKTGALLAAYERGARPIGDDRVLLSPDGGVVVGLGRPVVVKDWHVAQLPRVRAMIGARRGALARAGYAVASRKSTGNRSRWGRLLDRAVSKARGLASVEIDLSSGDEGSDARPRARPRVLLLMETHDDERVVAERVDPALVAPRLAAHARGELLTTLRAQLAYEYAHPGNGWRGVDEATRIAAKIIERAVRGIPAWIVRHPYPCSLERMHAVTSEIAASVA